MEFKYMERISLIVVLSALACGLSGCAQDAAVVEGMSKNAKDHAIKKKTNEILNKFVKKI